MKDIRSWTDKQLANLENNYLKKQAETGGPFSLAEVRLEILRRLPSPMDKVEVARKIVELAKATEDHLTTYGELWSSLNPDQDWKGNATQQIVANSLGQVIAYCVDNDMPILTTLVVRASNRQLSDEAVGHIYNESRSLGVQTGPDPKAFVANQRDLAIAWTEFPDE
jgi:hypothetical protein